MKIIAIILSLAAPAAAWQASYRVGKNPDIAAVIARVEASTGLDFQAKCASCTVNGHVSIDPDRPEWVQVVVYQGTSKGRFKCWTVTPALKKKVGQAVLGRP